MVRVNALQIKEVLHEGSLKNNATLWRNGITEARLATPLPVSAKLKWQGSRQEWRGGVGGGGGDLVLLCRVVLVPGVHLSLLRLLLLLLLLLRERKGPGSKRARTRGTPGCAAGRMGIRYLAFRRPYQGVRWLGTEILPDCLQKKTTGWKGINELSGREALRDAATG